MKPSAVADLLRQALNQRYPTGIAFIDYDADFSTLSVEWVDGSADQIDVAVRHVEADSKRWERVQG